MILLKLYYLTQWDTLYKLSSKFVTNGNKFAFFMWSKQKNALGGFQLQFVLFGTQSIMIALYYSQID